MDLRGSEALSTPTYSPTTRPQNDQPERLAYIRLGSFSGSALSLLRALESIAPVADWDLSKFARRPGLIPARIVALAEARRAGAEVPWTKTAAWSKATQRVLTR